MKKKFFASFLRLSLVCLLAFSAFTGCTAYDADDYINLPSVPTKTVTEEVLEPIIFSTAPISVIVPEVTTPVTTTIPNISVTTRLVDLFAPVPIDEYQGIISSTSPAVTSADVTVQVPDSLSETFAASEITVSDSDILTANINLPLQYNSLTQTQKELLLLLCSKVSSLPLEVVEFPADSGYTEQDFEIVYEMLISYLPSLWYLSDEYIKHINTTTQYLAGITMTYKDTPARITGMAEKIDAETEKVLAGISGMTDYEKVITFFEYLCDNITYDNDETSPYCYTIYGAFITRKANCQGYANALKLLCNKSGIECYTVPGEDKEGAGHMWNIVKLDGNWYVVDATYTDGGTYKRYDYCLTTTEKMAALYTIIDDRVVFPECNSIADNYYVRSGLYATNVTEAVSILSREISKAAKNKTYSLQIMCDSQETFDAVCARVFNPESSDNLFELIKRSNAENTAQISEDPVSYSASDKTYVIRVFLDYAD
ncbi:MAG: hypothetical protein LBM87_03670 [Ruminococcus sp.]|jgi:hypothetical protein|nr:hypothetical protein [Ruminococcus sp.]